MSLGTKEKDPDSRLDYPIKWHQWLAADEEIITSEWDVPEGLENVGENLLPKVTIIWLSGGEVGSTYLITNSITTSMGRETDRSFHLYVKEA